MSDYQSADLQERVRARTIRPANEPGTKQAAPVHPVVQMQRHLGNAQIARMIAQRQAEEDELQAKHDPAIQRAQEEDELQAKHDPAIQRAQEDDELQAMHSSAVQREGAIGLEGGPVGDSMASQINSARGSGSSLDAGVRSQVEGALGADLSGVRVHQDSQSDQLNRSMTAKAFTTGSDIFLRGDASASDTSLMAHELTHVVQQSSGSVGGAGGGMSVGAADDFHEHEADAVAQSITSGAAQRMGEESPGG